MPHSHEHTNTHTHTHTHSHTSNTNTSYKNAHKCNKVLTEYIPKYLETKREQGETIFIYTYPDC